MVARYPTQRKSGNSDPCDDVSVLRPVVQIWFWHSFFYSVPLTSSLMLPQNRYLPKIRVQIFFFSFIFFSRFYTYFILQYSSRLSSRAGTRPRWVVTPAPGLHVGEEWLGENWTVTGWELNSDWVRIEQISLPSYENIFWGTNSFSSPCLFTTPKQHYAKSIYYVYKCIVFTTIIYNILVNNCLHLCTTILDAFVQII